jgi:hypothetical protein
MFVQRTTADLTRDLHDAVSIYLQCPLRGGMHMAEERVHDTTAEESD